MRQLILVLFFSGAVLMSSAESAVACMWDQEVEAHEKQFKSTYTDQPTSTPITGQSLAQRLNSASGPLAGVGLLLLVGALVVRFVQTPNRTPVETDKP